MKIKVRRSGCGIAIVSVGKTRFMTVPFEWFAVYDALELARKRYPQCPFADRFLEYYYQLAEIGATDSIGGMEYRRNRREWNRVGRPSPREFLGDCVC